MQAYVGIEANSEFKLSEAVLIYQAEGEGAFASLHRIKQGDNGVPYLAPGEQLTTAFVRTLAQGLGAQVKPEIFSENILARTPDLLVWWSRPQQRVMFFGGTDEEARKINGLVFPHPALIFKVVGKDLFVRAVATSSRPSPETPLKTAPYWNTEVGAWSVPAACAYPNLPIPPRYLVGKIYIFNPNSRMRQEQCGLPATLKASLVCGDVLLARRGSQFST